MSLLLCPVCEICVFCHCERVIMFLVGFLPPMLLVSFIFSIVNLVDYLYCSLVKEREGGNLKSPATFMHMRLLFAWILFVWIWRISVSNQHIFLYIAYKKEFMLPPPAFLFYNLFLLLAYIITSFFNCQMLEDHPQIRNGVQLSVVQGYMSNFYRSLKCHWCSHWYSQNDLWHCVYVFMFRRYGTWVARNPTLVLCSSLAIVLVLCLGLIRFKVETRPEKVWFGA